MQPGEHQAATSAGQDRSTQIGQRLDARRAYGVAVRAEDAASLDQCERRMRAGCASDCISQLGETLDDVRATEPANVLTRAAVQVAELVHERRIAKRMPRRLILSYTTLPDDRCHAIDCLAAFLLPPRRLRGGDRRDED